MRHKFDSIIVRYGANKNAVHARAVPVEDVDAAAGRRRRRRRRRRELARCAFAHIVDGCVYGTEASHKYVEWMHGGVRVTRTGASHGLHTGAQLVHTGTDAGVVNGVVLRRRRRRQQHQMQISRRACVRACEREHTSWRPSVRPATVMGRGRAEAAVFECCTLLRGMYAPDYSNKLFSECARLCAVAD